MVSATATARVLGESVVIQENEGGYSTTQDEACHHTVVYKMTSLLPRALPPHSNHVPSTDLRDEEDATEGQKQHGKSDTQISRRQRILYHYTVRAETEQVSEG